MQIRDESQGVRKAKTWGELDPVGGGGNPTCGHLGPPLHWVVAVPEERQGAPPGRPICPLTRTGADAFPWYSACRGRPPSGRAAGGRQQEGDGLMMRIQQQQRCRRRCGAPGRPLPRWRRQPAAAPGSAPLSHANRRRSSPARQAGTTADPGLRRHGSAVHGKTCGVAGPDAGETPGSAAG